MRQVFEVGTAQDAHEATNHLFKHFIKPQTLDGVRGRVIWEPINTLYRHQLRKLFHGPVLTDFSEQVWLMDPATDARVRYTPAVWKRHLKDVFCPARFDAAGNELPKSTEALDNEAFSDFLLACQAYGCVELGIQFTEQDGGAT